MKINIVAVGKIKESYYTDAVNEYSKRISRFADFRVIEVAEAPQNKSIDEQKVIESHNLAEKAQGYIIALDPQGKKISSEGMADLIKSKCVEGKSEFSFLIGGSHGLSDEIKKTADLKISFSDLTFPHQLFRVMLSEQLYRALTIINNVPYHK
ncbi:MAG: 23S rRNA (pseudouridine(1915)-N(3))-methyltransferase RlmH [Clostridia bacterium]|nr:23S rRNA (pseudouridine(1915)-N(3))-methyltransferase RlmH [Clostridia bacterium]